PDPTAPRGDLVKILVLAHQERAARRRHDREARRRRPPQPHPHDPQLYTKTRTVERGRDAATAAAAASGNPRACASEVLPAETYPALPQAPRTGAALLARHLGA